MVLSFLSDGKENDNENNALQPFDSNNIVYFKFVIAIQSADVNA